MKKQSGIQIKILRKNKRLLALILLLYYLVALCYPFEAFAGSDLCTSDMNVLITDQVTMIEYVRTGNIESVRKLLERRQRDEVHRRCTGETPDDYGIVANKLVGELIATLECILTKCIDLLTELQRRQKETRSTLDIEIKVPSDNLESFVFVPVCLVFIVDVSKFIKTSSDQHGNGNNEHVKHRKISKDTQIMESEEKPEEKQETLTATRKNSEKEVDDIIQFLFGTDHFIVEKTDEDNAGIYFDLRSITTNGICPECGAKCDKPNGTAKRMIELAPIERINGVMKPVYLRFTVKKWKCEKKSCCRFGHKTRTFTEPVPFAAHHMRMSFGMAKRLILNSIDTSDRGMDQTTKAEGSSFSRYQIANARNKLFIEDEKDYAVIGIDEVANGHKGEYDTVIYNSKHEIIALFEGRTGEGLRDWLKEHPCIIIINRDRASSYGSILKEMLPDAIQVADPFHYLKNICEHLEAEFKDKLPKALYIEKASGKLVNAPEEIVKEKPCPESLRKTMEDKNFPVYDNSDPGVEYWDEATDRKTKEKKVVAQQIKILDLLARWKAFDKSQGQAKARKAFIEQEHLAKKDCHLLDMTEDEILNLGYTGTKRRKSATSDYHNIIYKMLRDKQEPEVIYYYCRNKAGYNGDPVVLWNKIYDIAVNNFPIHMKKDSCPIIEKCYSEDVMQVNNMELLRFLLTMDQTAERKTKEKDARFLLLKKASEEIYKQYPDCVTAHTIMDEFYDATRRNPDIEKLNQFLEKYQACGYKEIESFCAGIRLDYDAICNSIKNPSSNSGYVEGGNRMYKTQKAVIFGKWGLRTRRIRAMMASRINKPGFNIEEYIDWSRTGRNAKASKERIGQHAALWD